MVQMKDKCCRYLIFWCKKTHTQTMFFDVTKSLIKNVSKLRVQMFLFYCQNIVLGRSWISIFDCQGSFETFLVIVIFCWQTVLFLTAYPPSVAVTAVAIQHILSVRRNRYTGAGEPRGTTDYEYGYGPIHYVLRLQVPEPKPEVMTIVYHLFRVSVLRWPWWPLCPGLAPLLIRPGPGSREWRVWSVTKANTHRTPRPLAHRDQVRGSADGCFHPPISVTL